MRAPMMRLVLRTGRGANEEVSYDESGRYYAFSKRLQT